MIPAEAVEAAAKAMWDASDPVRKKARPTWESIANDPDWRRAVEYNRKDAKVALEAVAPYMLADAWEQGRLVGRAEEQSGFDTEMNPYGDPYMLNNEALTRPKPSGN